MHLSMKIITWAFLSVALMACSGGTGQDVSKAPATDTDTAEIIQKQPETTLPPTNEAPEAESSKRKNVLDYYRSLEPPYTAPTS